MAFGFGKALDVLRDGDAVTRHGWKHPEVVFGSVQKIKLEPLSEHETAHGENGVVCFEAAIMRIRPGLDEDYWAPWMPTHADLLAEDWDYVR